jgi:hypothetical protein
MLAVNALYLHIHCQLKTKQMKNKLKTIWHDFWTDPLYYLAIMSYIGLLLITLIVALAWMIQPLIK